MHGELCCENWFYRKEYLCELLSPSAFKVFKPTASRERAMLSTLFSHLALLPPGAMEWTGR